MATLSLRNGVFVSLLPDVDVQCGDVRIENGVITDVGPGVAAADPNAVDCQGALVLPGLVNAHTHLYSALAVGMPAPSVAPTNFVEILERIWWRLDRALDQESLYLSALVGGLEAARHGVTVLFDHHASPNFIEGSLNEVTRALDEVGLSAVLCYEVTDRGGPEQCQAGIAENESYATGHRDTQGQFEGLIGGHAAFTLSDETLSGISAACERAQRGFHIHVAEDLADVTSGDPVARYLAANLLSKDTILAHCVHLDEAALKQAEQAGCWLVHNARSNMNNAVGYAQLAAAYPNLAVGTDGIGCDILSEVKTAFYKARDEHVPTAWALPVRLLQGGLRMAEQFLGRTMGRFTPGAVGDVVLTDYRLNTEITADNLAGHLVFGLGSSHIQQVWAGGQQIWPTPLDERMIAAKARDAAGTLWRRMGELDG